jgi:hypothetical protein
MLEDIINTEERDLPSRARLPFGGLGLLGNFMSLEEIIQ